MTLAEFFNDDDPTIPPGTVIKTPSQEFRLCVSGRHIRLLTAGFGLLEKWVICSVPSQPKKSEVLKLIDSSNIFGATFSFESPKKTIKTGTVIQTEDGIYFMLSRSSRGMYLVDLMTGMVPEFDYYVSTKKDFDQADLTRLSVSMNWRIVGNQVVIK